jgi:ubiquinone/menaquinone biosynthesis C-methylase UbiE
LLARFAETMQGKGIVCDIGCGPGQTTRFLRDHGLVDIFGLDLSSGMVETAQTLNPDISFRQGNMLALPADDESWAGVVAFYSIIHIPRNNVVQALREIKRVLQPGGLFFFTFHRGQEIIHLDEWWGHEVSIDFIFFEVDEMRGYLLEAGFEIDEIIERDPYPEVEHPSRRAYIFARKPI